MNRGVFILELTVKRLLNQWKNETQGVFGTSPLEGLLQRSQSRFGGATICGSSKMAPAPLLFTEKRLLHENVWQGSFEGARAGAGEELTKQAQ